MKSNKLKLLSLLAVSAMLFACGGNKPSSSQEGEEPSSSETNPSEEKPSSENSSEENSSSDNSSEEKPSSENSSEEPIVEPKPVEKTVNELADAAPTADRAEMYHVKGVWVPTGNETDKYGNGFLADKESGKKLQVYGMAPTKDAFTYDGKAYTFKNPQKFQELKTSFAAGDEITLGMVYSTQYKNYYTYFIEKNAEASTISYNVTAEVDETKGSVVLSATTGVYGTEITATVTANAGFKVDQVTYNGTTLQGTDGAYKFTVAPGENKVKATFLSEDAVVTKFTLTAANLLGYAGSNVNYPAVGETVTKTVSDSGETIDFKYNQIGGYGKGIQTRIKDTDKALLFNSTPFSYEIESITIVKNSEWTGKGVWSFSFGTAAIETLPATFAGTVNKDSTGDSLTIACDVPGAKFFRFDHTVSGGVNVDEIIVNFKVAA